jgi:hypothetical protein
MTEQKPTPLVSREAAAKKTLLGIAIPRDELALRIAIECTGVRPPLGMKAADALDQMDREFSTPIPMGTCFRRAADAAVIYFHQCINDARQPS